MTRLKGFFHTAPGSVDDPVNDHYYEAASDDPSEPQIWCYTNQISYAPGDAVQFHVSTTARTFVLNILRDGESAETLYRREGIAGAFHPTPADCSENGCGWPVAFEMKVPNDWPSGGYLVTTRAEGDDGAEISHDHMFILRGADNRPVPPILLIAATSTWIAYNEWGGSNHYEGLTGLGGNAYSPILSIERPWSRGFLRLPSHAPRIPHASPPGASPSYPHMEWAYANGFSKKYASAGWANYEGHFSRWADRQGLRLDYATQHDLHLRPEILRRYACVVIVGHDEYWSWEMRDAIDAYVDAGGHVARFAGNFFWQIRLENEGLRQVCYKYRAREEDPLRNSDDRRLTTIGWDAPETGRPGALTMGLTGAAGIYAGWGGCVARGADGFTVYRPEHEAFEGTGLGYGDVLGASARVFGYEVDGLDYVFRRGLPYPSREDGAPEGIEILALSPATAIEPHYDQGNAQLFIGDADVRFLAEMLHGAATPEAVDRVSRGSGMIAEYRRGAGSVFNAGSCEWVAGLIAGDRQIERITRNVITKHAT